MAGYPTHICPNCGAPGTPENKSSSSFVVEAVIWLMFLPVMFFTWLALLFPLAFTIWRANSTRKVCRTCGEGGMVPLDTPVGKSLVGKYKVEVEVAPKCQHCGKPLIKTLAFCIKCGKDIDRSAVVKPEWSSRPK